MCDMPSNVADTSTKASGNGKHRNASAATYTMIISFCKRYFDVAIVCVVIAVAWAILALPTIFYHRPMKTPKQRTGQNSSIVCTPEIYTGSICREALLAQQSCLLDQNTSSDIFIAVDPASSQSSREEQVNVFIQGLPFLAPSSECIKTVVPFLCFYTFPLCDNTSDLHQPSSEECREITDNICAREFQKAAMFVTDDQLPQCQLLPDTTLQCNASNDTVAQLEDTMNTESDEAVEDTVAEVNTSTGRVCNEGFYINEKSGLCTPECGVWEEFPHSFIVGVDAVVILLGIVYFLSGLAVLVLSCIDYKRMFSFPSVFVVYTVIAFGVVEVSLLSVYIDRPSLFCSSRDLTESVANETHFCTVQGLVFYYAALAYTMFWIFHIAILFWRIVFPFHARSYENRGYFRYIHIVMFIAAIILPLESVGVILGTGGLSTPRFPPTLCVARETDVTYYAFVLPICFTCATGVSLLVIILWVVITKVGNLKTQFESDGNGRMKIKKFCTPELKILIIFLHFCAFSVTSLTAFTVSAKNINEFESKLILYFACESQGIQPGRTCERNFDRMGVEVALIFAYILIGLIPVVSLIYVINYQEIKAKCLKRFTNRSGIGETI